MSQGLWKKLHEEAREDLLRKSMDYVIALDWVPDHVEHLAKAKAELESAALIFAATTLGLDKIHGGG